MHALAIFAGTIAGTAGWAAAGGGPETPSGAPAGWTVASPRAEIAPRFFVQRDPRSGGVLLGIDGKGDPAADGRWVRTVPVRAGAGFRFETSFQARSAGDLRRSVLARVVWLDAAGKDAGPADYPDEARAPGLGARTLSGWFAAPPGAVSARLEVCLRWAPDEVVLFAEPRLEESLPPAPRRVRLAAVNHRPSGGKSARENLLGFEAPIAEAARRKADIVCLPEGITICGTGLDSAAVAEPVPGPSTEFLGALAARHGLWIAGGIYEREGHTIYNTCVLLEPSGRLAGKYRKTAIPREEIDVGVMPGSSFPVFDVGLARPGGPGGPDARDRAGTVTVRVGLMICWDLSYPEVARALARQGAEVLLLPIWGGEEALARARAIENQVWLVASGYDFRTAIYDRTGKDVARASADPEVIVAEVDLGERTRWPWLGDWRSRIWREVPASEAHAAGR